MASRYKLFYDTVDIDTNLPMKGFMYEGIKETLNFSDDYVYTIPKTMEYRPDLIANYFYEDTSLSYILIYANAINDSPEGFYYGRQIRVPRYDRIINLG